MPRVVRQITGAQWEKDGPQSPTQKFFKQYVNAVDSRGYDSGSGLKFYSKDVAWMKKLFDVFERIQHDWVQFLEVERDDGTSQIYTQNVRNLWLRGNKGDKPTVSIPVTMIAIIGKSGSDETAEGMHFKEVWLYWDTALLLPYLPKEAVVFKTKNVVRTNEE
ncbi:hypothetical protein ACHAP8_011781 [Fusarium lateritium]